MKNKGAVDKGGQTVERIDLQDAWETSNIDCIFLNRESQKKRNGGLRPPIIRNIEEFLYLSPLYVM